MNDKQLTLLLASAEAGSFNKASEQLYLSKQALIKQINSLEQELHFPIFIRESTGIRPTPAGEELIRLSRDLLLRWEEGIIRCQAIAASRKTLRISIPSHPRQLLERAITEFSREHPEIRQELVFRSPGENGIAMLLDGTADVAECMVRKEYDRPELASVPLEKLPYRCLLAPSHPLAGKAFITPEDLHGAQICIGSPDRNLAIIDLLNQRAGGYSRIEHRTEDLEFTLNFCINQGIVITKSYFAVSLPPLISLPIVPEIASESRLYYRKDTTPEVDAFLDIVSRSYGASPQALGG